MSRLIRIESQLGMSMLVRVDDILNVWDVPDKHLRVINFKQGEEQKQVWTEESFDSLQERITNIIKENMK